MSTFLYECKIHGEFEAEHSITTELETCPKCKEEGKRSDKPKRLIAASNFILKGGAWGKEGYSRK